MLEFQVDHTGTSSLGFHVSQGEGAIGRETAGEVDGLVFTFGLVALVKVVPFVVLYP